MKLTARTLITGTVLLTALAACTDLTVNPKSTISGTNVFSDTSSYRAFIARIYGGLQVTGQQGPAGLPDISGIDEGFSQYIRLWWQMEELPTDEAVIAWGDAGVQELNTQQWGSNNQFLVSMYYRIYLQVALANEFLRQTTDAQLASRNVTGDLAANVKQYRAEARFLRALSYWHAIDLFGDVPLVKEDFPLGKTPPPQATRADVYNFIVSELNAISADLPAVGAAVTNPAQYGRADQGVVAMLLAKVYQNASVYIGQDHSADARAQLEKIINSPAYSLDPSYRHLFLADNNTSKEIIFAVPFDGTRTQSYGGTTFLVHAEVGGNMNATAFGIDGGWYGLRVRPEAVAQLTATPSTDKRQANNLFTSGQSLDIQNLTDFNSGYASQKYRNVTSTGQPGSNPGFADIDFPMFRLGDAYLMYAEAVLRGGGGSATTALNLVNALRVRAFGDSSGVISSAQLTLPFVLAERARELLWEGHRRTDLIRFNQFTTNGVWEWKGGVKAGKVTDAKYNLYPLPGSELLANPNLKQNPGY